MASGQSDAPSPENWSLFLRQRRLHDQLRRLRNDFKNCHCPPGCRGLPQDHVVVAPRDVPGLPAQPVHAPPVAVESDLPDTWARPMPLRGPESTILAEARGTSDIRLHRTGARATLRMSMQVRSDPTLAGRTAYFGEMFLTQHDGRAEEFVGFIQSWYMDRTRRPGRPSWEAVYLDGYGDRFTLWRDDHNDMESQRTYFQRLFGEYFGVFVDPDRDRDGRRLPDDQFRGHFAAAWARANEDTDIVYIPLVWIDQHFTGQRIIDQGFELFWRLMTGGSLPEPYNITRPLTALLEAGELGPPYSADWQGGDGRAMTWEQRMATISRAYERNGFMALNPTSETNFFMGRRVDPADYAGAGTGDMAIVPPNPPATNLETPSPVRQRRARRWQGRYWPKRGRREDDGDDDHGGDDGNGDDDGGDDHDDHDGSPLAGRGQGRGGGGPRGGGAPGTGMGRGRPPPRTPRGGGRGGRPVTPSGPSRGRFATPPGERPSTGGLSLFGSTRRRLFR